MKTVIGRCLKKAADKLELASILLSNLEFVTSGPPEVEYTPLCLHSLMHENHHQDAKSPMETADKNPVEELCVALGTSHAFQLLGFAGGLNHDVYVNNHPIT